jgi:hypothetical protein
MGENTGGNLWGTLGETGGFVCFYVCEVGSAVFSPFFPSPGMAHQTCTNGPKMELAGGDLGFLGYFGVVSGGLVGQNALGKFPWDSVGDSSGKTFLEKGKVGKSSGVVKFWERSGIRLGSTRGSDLAVFSLGRPFLTLLLSKTYRRVQTFQVPDNVTGCAWVRNRDLKGRGDLWRSPSFRGVRGAPAGLSFENKQHAAKNRATHSLHQRENNVEPRRAGMF